MKTYGVEIEFIVSAYDRRFIAEQIKRKTGVVVSLASYSDKDATAWRLKTDSSVHGRGYGMELVTPVLRGELDLQKLQAVVGVITEFGHVNKSCGLHVHHGVQGISKIELKRILKFYLKYEYAIDNLLPPSRRGNDCRYAESNYGVIYENDDLARRFAYLNGAPNRQRLLSNRNFGDKYKKLNTGAYRVQGTLEFRQHSGTLCAEKIANWVRLTSAIIEMSTKRGTVIRKDDTYSTYTTKQMLTELKRNKLITRDTYFFYKRRFKELNNEIYRW